MTKKTTPKKKPSTKKTAPKKAPSKKPAAKPEELSLKIVSTTKTETLSGKSTLTYNIGMDDEAHFFIRLLSNTGGGHFSKQWLAVDDIKSLLSDIPDERPITSQHLTHVFKAVSANNAGFLLAALVKEKIVSPLAGKKRQFAYTGKGAPVPKTTKRKRRT